MPAYSFRLQRLVLGLALCAAAAGCGTQRMASAVSPYKVQIVQGNFVSTEQVEYLRPGMARQQVRDVLGTPLLASVFHEDRWDYVFTLRRDGVEAKSYRLTVYFKGDVLERFEGDTMPTEAEFVAGLDVRSRGKGVPALEATEAQLRRYPAPAKAPAGAVAPAAPAPSTYPPLESPAR